MIVLFSIDFQPGYLVLKNFCDISKESFITKEMSYLNPMVMKTRFPHIVEKVFVHMDKNNLINCRQVAKPWQNYIDNKLFLWNKIVDEQGSNKAFQIACKNGFSKFVEMVLKKPTNYNIDLNAQCPVVRSNKVPNPIN